MHNTNYKLVCRFSLTFTRRQCWKYNIKIVLKINYRKSQIYNYEAHTWNDREFLILIIIKKNIKTKEDYWLIAHLFGVFIDCSRAILISSLLNSSSSHRFRFRPLIISVTLSAATPIGRWIWLKRLPIFQPPLSLLHTNCVCVSVTTHQQNKIINKNILFYANRLTKKKCAVCGMCCCVKLIINWIYQLQRLCMPAIKTKIKNKNLKSNERYRKKKQIHSFL